MPGLGRAFRRIARDPHSNYYTMLTAWGRLAVLLLFGWAVFLVVVGLAGPPIWFTGMMALSPALIIPLVLFAFPVWITVAWTIDETQRVIKSLLGIIAAELFVGWYLTVVPVANDRELVPLLILSTIILVLTMVSTQGKIRKWSFRLFFATITIITVIFLSGGRSAVSERLKEMKAPKPAEAAETIEPAAYLPPPVEKKMATEACAPGTYPPVAENLAKPSRIVAENGSYIIYWTGNEPNGVLPFLRKEMWPEGADEVTIQLSYLDGHFDFDDEVGANGKHLTFKPTWPRNYRAMGYCTEYEYPFPQLHKYLGPAQAALVMDIQNPKRGVYPFSDFGGNLPPVTVKKEDSPVLLLVDHITADNGALGHQVRLRLTVTPAPYVPSFAPAEEGGTEAVPERRVEPGLAGELASPLDSYQITRGRHGRNAVDLYQPCGENIYAAAAGVVTEVAYERRGHGKYFVIQHGNGVETLYAHASRIFVSPGDSVSRRQRIAEVGNTGVTRGPTGCHLHFEVHGARNPFLR